jgi:sortase A
MKERAILEGWSAGSLRRWVEPALWLVAVLCLGTWAWSYLDSRLYQSYESWRFSRALAARPAAGVSAPAPLSPPPAGRQLPAQLPADEGAASGAPAAPTQAQAERPEPEEGEPLGRLEAPRLGLSVMVSQGVSGRTLRRSAGHIPGTALPGELGNVGIAGHRDTFFRPLKEIRKNDTLTLTTLQGTYQYVVDSTEIVSPDNVKVLDPTDRPVLTLVTCYPFYYVGSAPKRFIVQAHLAS